jgi:hypothetical protein
MNIVLADQHLLCGVGMHPFLCQEQVLIPLVTQAAKAVKLRGVSHG